MKLGRDQLGRRSPDSQSCRFRVHRNRQRNLFVERRKPEEISKPQGGSAPTVVQYLQKRLAVCSACCKVDLAALHTPYLCISRGDHLPASLCNTVDVPGLAAWEETVGRESMCVHARKDGIGW